MHKNKKCQFCDIDVVCMNCNCIIDCKNITDCDMCGDYYGRPLVKSGKRILSNSALIINNFPNKKTIILILDKGKLSDPGGKFDPSQDIDNRSNAMRELREETGIYSIITETTKYTTVQNSNLNAHGCFLLIQTPKNRSVSPMKTQGELTPLEIPLVVFLMLPPSILSSRLNRIMKSKIGEHPLRSYLQYMVDN